MLQDFSFQGARQINAAGRFFYYSEPLDAYAISKADLRIRVAADGTSLGTLRPGEWVKLPRDVSRWDVTPMDPTLIGTVLIGYGEFGSARLAGIGKVAETQHDKTVAGNQFIIGNTQLANATKAGIVAVLPGSKPLAIKRIVMGSSGAQQLTMFQCTGLPTDTPGGIVIRNKDTAGAAPLATGGIGLSTAGGSPTVGELPGRVAWMGFVVASGVPFEWPLTSPIIVRPGSGLAVVGSTVNMSVYLSLDFEELQA